MPAQVYLAAGFWASHLAVLVKTLRFMEQPASLAHSALLLAVFGSAGFKEEHTGLLAMTLPALLCNVPSAVCSSVKFDDRWRSMGLL